MPVNSDRRYEDGARRVLGSAPRCLPFLTPAATAPRDSAKPNFFADYRPDADKLKRSARRPQRRERGR
jgi:hypothetical protein